MTIIKRADLGRPLTWDELDDNFQQVDNLTAAASAAVSSAAASAAAAASISVSLEEKIDAQLSEQATEFESQMTDQQSSFTSQLNQQLHIFDDQLSDQQARLETVIKNAGSQVLGHYEDGPWTLTSYNQLISYGGTFWKLAASVVIGSGYTTAGTTESTWNATDKANFVDVGQDQLRSELGTIFMPGPSGNATTDVQLLKSALNVGGFINYNVPGKYLYNDSSVIK